MDDDGMDYDYDFRYAGKVMMPMASLDRNGNVVYIGALTKLLAPAIYNFKEQEKAIEILKSII